MNYLNHAERFTFLVNKKIDFDICFYSPKVQAKLFDDPFHVVHRKG